MPARATDDTYRAKLVKMAIPICQSARGPHWNRKDRKASRLPPRLRGVHRDSEWGCSPHHAWLQGYSYEVVVTAPRNGPVRSLPDSLRLPDNLNQ